MYGSINSNILKIQQRKIGRIFSRWKWRSFSIWKMYFIICASYWKKIYKMITIDSFLSRNRKLWSLHIDFVFQIQMILEIEKCVNGNFSREKKNMSRQTIYWEFLKWSLPIFTCEWPILCSELSCRLWYMSRNKCCFLLIYK